MPDQSAQRNEQRRYPGISGEVALGRISEPGKIPERPGCHDEKFRRLRGNPAEVSG